MSATATSIALTAAASESTSSQTSTASLGITTANAGPDGPPGISRSSSLLFGFLLSFLALFVIFMACGFGSRRALSSRRRRLLADTLDESNDGLKEVKRPLMWDVWIAEADADRRVGWNGMMPLSVKLLNAKNVDSDLPPAPVRAEAPAPLAPFTAHTASATDYFPTYIASGRGIARLASTPPTFVSTRSPSRPPPRSGGSTSASNPRPVSTPPNRNPGPGGGGALTTGLLTVSRRNWTFWNHRKGKKREPSSSDDTAPVEALQVSTLIAMPTPRRRSEKDEMEMEESGVSVVDESSHTDQPLGELVLGLLEVPWFKDNIG